MVTVKPPRDARLDERRGGLRVELRAGALGQADQTGVEGRRLQASGATDHHAAVVDGRADLVEELVAFDEAHVFTQLVAVLGGEGAQLGHHPGCVGEVELAGAGVVAVDVLALDQRLDLVERLVDLRVEHPTERPVLALECRGAGFELGDDHAPVARRRATSEWVLLEQHGVQAPSGALTGRGQAGVAAPDDDHVRGRGQRLRLDPRGGDLGLPEDRLGVVGRHDSGHARGR